MKRLLFCALMLFFLQTISAQTITIMIDPGHGGSDPGHLSANSKHLKEKELNLIIAKKFGAYLTENMSNVKILYTRTDDSFPSLDERVEKANSQKVDYFISIHCNASSNKSIHGTESHVHNMSATKSVKLANYFEKEFKNKAGRKSRGVKDSDDREHTLQVLKFTQMTSVLVECGFLTNVAEANYLNTKDGQDVIASALYRGLKTYLKEAHPSINFTKGSSQKTDNSTATKENTEKSGNYTVQIMSSKEWMDTEKAPFTQLTKAVNREQVAQSGYKYRYTSGSFSTKEEAEKYKNEVRKKGFPDAMIIKSTKSS